MNLNYCPLNLYSLLYISHLLCIISYQHMHVCLGIQETIYLLFHSASLYSDKDKWTISQPVERLKKTAIFITEAEITPYMQNNERKNKWAICVFEDDLYFCKNVQITVLKTYMESALVRYNGDLLSSQRSEPQQLQGSPFEWSVKSLLWN